MTGTREPLVTGAGEDEADARTRERLAQVREQVAGLLTSLDRPPRSVRVAAGEVTVEIIWDDTAPGTPAPAVPAPAASAAPAAPPPAGTADGGTGQAYLRAPAVGVFYHAPSPGAEPFVTVGSEVWPGTQIGIIEAMKLMIPVEADREGTIAAAVKGNGEPVEFDEPLFALASGEA